MLSFPLHPRYARMLLAAHDYGCVRPVALIAALTQGRQLLLRSEGKRMDEERELLTGGETGSDFFLLMRAWRYAAQNQFDFQKCKRLGIHVTTARQVGHLLDQFLHLAAEQGLDISEKKSDPVAIQKSILLGFSDQVGRRLDRGTLRCQLLHQRRGTLARDSVVQESELLVVAEVREIQGKELNTLLTLATEVKEDWLRELFPHDFSEQRHVFFDAHLKRVVGQMQKQFRDLPLSSGIPVEPTPEEAAALLTEEIIQGRLLLNTWDDAVEQWIHRLNRLCEWMPELGLPPLMDADRADLLQQFCYGAFGYKDIKDKPVSPVLKSWLSPQQQAWLEEFVPERLTLPNGRKAKITYSAEGAPVLAARIQDLYGVDEGLTIVQRRVPLVIQILAPNFRPIQITQNLEVFWRDSYPKIKQELQRKYPKHEWR